MFWNKKTPALKPSPRCTSVTVYTEEGAQAVYNAPDPATRLVVRTNDIFVRVQVSHEDYDRDVTLVAYKTALVESVAFGYEEAQP